ncbi:glycosyltransferase [Providencia stuartii]|uniref:glycosyltransferase n=1 Tax=Providencia stuartii TaxID=588 RepID=UPI0024AA1147|nr:glycosyltransferase [Providencia stuartii]MCX3071627.1 glycosyltransferase [Providencia stuartii]
MKTENSLQIGNFGGSLNQIDGQTIKTVMFGELLDSIHKKNIKIDIYNYNLLQTLLLFFLLPVYIAKAKYIYIGLGKKGMLFFSPWVILLSLLFRRKIIYYVIGGWIIEFLLQNKFLISLFKKFNAILVELPSMIELGKELGMNNMYFFPNFRITQHTPEIKPTKKDNLKLLFYSRIIKEKGITDAIDAINLLYSNGYNVSLDIYGPIIDNSLLTNIGYSDRIKYKGVISPLDKNMYNIINAYDLLIFPTYYNGEGFPGAITDAFISGVPVAATYWKYNAEIVDDNKNGFLFSPNDIKSLCDKIIFFYNNPEELDILKKNAKLDSYKYSFKNAKNILLSVLTRF